ANDLSRVACRPGTTTAEWMNERRPEADAFRFSATCRSRLLRCRRQLLDRARHHAHARRVLRAAGVAVHLLCERCQCCATLGAMLPLRCVDCCRNRTGAIGGEAAVAHELVEVRAHYNERRWPDELRLAL